MAAGSEPPASTEWQGGGHAADANDLEPQSAVRRPPSAGDRPPRAAVFLASASFAAIGACATLPGSLLPILVDTFGIRLVEAGSMLALQPIGYLVSVLGARSLIARYGARRVTAGGLLIFGLGIAAFGLTSDATQGAAALLLSGLGFGSMEVAGNAVVLALGGQRNNNLLNFVHLFFGVGSLATPAIATHAVADGVSWRWVFAVAGGLTAVIALGWSLVADVSDATATPRGAARRRSRLVPVLLASILGLYVGVETGVGGWLTKFMVSERGVSLPFAGNVLSSYWLGLAAGRFVLAFAAHYVEERNLLLGLTIAATAALTTAIVLGGPWAASIAFAATGLGYSGIFPAVITLGGRHQPEDTAAITSILIAGAGIGSIAVPWLMSAIADGISLSAGMGFYALMTGVMAVLAAVAARVLGSSFRVPGSERSGRTGLLDSKTRD